MTVAARELVRSAYHLVRRLPLIGPLTVNCREAIRKAPRINVFASISQLQDLVNAHSIALSGLRDANQRLRTDIVKELDDRVHYQNQKIDRDHDETTKRLEFIRTEVLLEVRRLVRADLAGAQRSADIATEIISPSKVEDQRRSGTIRVNVGCGHIPLDNYINIDYRTLPGVDIVASADKLPFSPGEVAEIYGAHIAEHFPRHAFESQIIPAWKKCLRSGGLLRLVVPNVEAMMREWHSGTLDFDTLAMIIMGGQEYEGDFHYAVYNPETLQRLLIGAGFKEVAVITEARRNGLCLETELTAVKP